MQMSNDSEPQENEKRIISLFQTHANNSYVSLYAIFVLINSMASERDWQLLNKSVVKCILLVASSEGGTSDPLSRV